VPGASFEAITGRLGVGAVAFLGMFLIFDGLQIGVYALVEEYAQSTAWGIVGVIPTAVVTYIVGVVCVGIAESMTSRLPFAPSPTPEEIAAVSHDGGPLLQQVYSGHLRNHELLTGASFAFLVLAIGCMAETPNMPGNAVVVWLSTLGALALAALSLLFARRAALRASALASAVPEKDA
jgi:hypothetical protein